MILILVAALAENRVIGRDGDLPWHLPADLKHFKAMTLGKPVIMGRKTWESLRVRPLPGRRNIVVTRNAGFDAPGAETAPSLDDALAMVAEAPEAAVIGGAALFEKALSRAEILHLTEVHAEIAGDVYFPAVDPANWQETARERHPADGAAPAHSFVTLERRRPTD
jgi:dihydrofolate reductase